MSADIPITKEKLDIYLKEVAKQFRKLNKKGMPADFRRRIVHNPVH